MYLKSVSRSCKRGFNSVFLWYVLQGCIKDEESRGICSSSHSCYLILVICYMLSVTCFCCLQYDAYVQKDTFKNLQKKMPQSGIVQALYATPAWACFFFNVFYFGGICKI